MKIIRPEYTEFKKEEIKVDRCCEDDLLYAERRSEPVEKIMDEVLKKDFSTLKENEVEIKIVLTKKQEAIFYRKGGVKWLKKKLVGQSFKK